MFYTCSNCDAMSAGTGYLVLGSMDAYGHLIVSKLDANGKGKSPLFISYITLV